MKTIEELSCGAFPTSFSMSIQILQLLSMQFFTVLKTRQNGVVDCRRSNRSWQNNPVPADDLKEWVRKQNLFADAEQKRYLV
jgi:hypothetical protein